MDAYCGRCGEPFDMDELHHGWEGPDGTILSYAEGVAAFRREGCAGVGLTCNAATVGGEEQLAAAAAWETTAHADEQGAMVADFAWMFRRDTALSERLA